MLGFTALSHVLSIIIRTMAQYCTRYDFRKRLALYHAILIACRERPHMQLTTEVCPLFQERGR